MSGARGIVHVHSSYSYDSRTPLRAVKALAAARGLSFVAQTEHSNRLTAKAHAQFVAEARSLSDPGFLMLPGVEYATADNRIHVLVLGVEDFWEDLRLCPVDRLGELLGRVRAGGGLSVLAHPERADAIACIPPEALERIDAIEVWNGKTDKFGPSPRAIAEVLQRRREGRRTPALAGLDLHAEEDYRPVGIEIEAPLRSARELIDLIRESRFRVFFGPFRWDTSRCGPLAVAVGRASKAAVDAARATKRGLRAMARRSGS